MAGKILRHSRKEEREQSGVRWCHKENAEARGDHNKEVTQRI